MKREAIVLAMAAIAFVASAQQPATANPPLPVDTLVVVNGADRVTVTETPQSSVITIVGSKDSPNYYYSHTTEVVDPEKKETAAEDEEWGLSLPFLKEKTHKRFSKICGDQVYVGVGVPCNEVFTAIDPSWEFGVGKVIGLRYSPWRQGPDFSIGVGFQWQSFNLHGGKLFGMKDRALILVNGEENFTGMKSRLRNFGLTVPFTIRQKIFSDVFIAGGVELHYNTYTYANSEYHIGNTRYKQDFKSLHQRQATFVWYGALSWNDLGVYLRYQPNGLFSKQWGPTFEVLSFGLTIGI